MAFLVRCLQEFSVSPQNFLLLIGNSFVQGSFSGSNPYNFLFLKVAKAELKECRGEDCQIILLMLSRAFLNFRTLPDTPSQLMCFRGQERHLLNCFVQSCSTLGFYWQFLVGWFLGSGSVFSFFSSDTWFIRSRDALSIYVSVSWQVFINRLAKVETL